MMSSLSGRMSPFTTAWCSGWSWYVLRSAGAGRQARGGASGRRGERWNGTTGSSAGPLACGWRRGLAESGRGSRLLSAHDLQRVRQHRTGRTPRSAATRSPFAGLAPRLPSRRWGATYGWQSAAPELTVAAREHNGDAVREPLGAAREVLANRSALDHADLVFQCQDACTSRDERVNNILSNGRVADTLAESGSSPHSAHRPSQP